MPKYSVTIEFEKPASLKAWDTYRMAKIEREWFELRKAKGIPLSLTSTSIAMASDEFWRYHFRLHDADISVLLDAIEESKLATPYKCFYRVEEEYDSREEYDKLLLKQMNHLAKAPVADLIQYVELFLMNPKNAWIKDMPVIERALLEDPVNSWKATLYHGSEALAYASINLLAYTRREEFYHHLGEAGYNLDGAPFSHVAKILGFMVPPKEVVFEFTGTLETDLKKSKEAINELWLNYYPVDDDF